ncbi:tape measure protein [Nostoc sp.]|uniref:tape measure protein n=1 Tax=Nostoc sp. TaxID=1180 RepID=UPI002FF7B2CF
MSSLGSASIQLKLDRSRFDSDLQKLSQKDAGSIAIRAKLDTKDFEQQLKGLRSQLKPIYIPVELDTLKFNEQIKKLSANIDPIKIDLAPNVKDFQEKLKRIGRISPIEVEVKVDKTAVKSQFTEIGRYAAEGFAQGFSGAEDAGKSAVDSMVRSVKSQLGIQSPSKVFREIGRYAAEGLSEGLREIDDGEIDQRVDRIINQFERISNYKFGNIGNGITGLITKPLKAIESVILAPFKGIETLILAPFKGLRSVILAPFDGIKSIIESTFSAFRNISFSISVDSASVRRQFREIGSNAAAGFAEGFSGIDNAARGAIDSIVRAVRTQLGIQSPSKVFKEIGKYAIAGMMQGLDSVDESKLKGVVDKVENYFKKSKIKINLDIDASGISGRVKAQAPVSPVERTGDFGKNITKSIEDGFQKAKPKANFLGAIFGGLGSLITVPLAATLRGAFEGIGTPLGLQLGTGVTKAFQSTLGANIGSLELISQKAIEKSLQAIPAAQSAIVEVIKNNPIGGAVVKQLELLQKTLESYGINLSPQEAVKSLATDGERAAASSSANFESITTRSKTRKKAKAAASDEFVSIVEQRGSVEKINSTLAEKEKSVAQKAKEIKQIELAIAKNESVKFKLDKLPSTDSEDELKKRETIRASADKNIAENKVQLEQAKKTKSLPEKVAHLEEIQTSLSKAKATQDKFSLLPKATSKEELQKRAVFELAVKKEIAELSEILAVANAEIASDIKEIEGLKKAKSAYLEKLNKQVRVLAELGVEKDLSSQTAEILKGIDVFEQLVSAQKGVANARKNVKTNANTPEPIRQKKLEKLEGLALGAKTNLEQALANPGTDASEIPKLKKRATSANKALDLYKLEISDPAKEIEKLNQKLANGNAALAKNILELQTRLTKAIPALFNDASQEVVKVANLNQIPGTTVAIEKDSRQKQESEKLRVSKLPKLYVDAVQSVSRIVTGKNLEIDKIPNIVPSDQVRGKGHYDAQVNTYRVRPDLYKQIETGDINQVTDEAIGNIVHEIFHGFQHSFGKAIAEVGKLGVDITPTPEELLKLGGKIEASVGVQREERKPLSRELETGANVFQLRHTDQVREELKRNQLKNQVLSLGGVAGSKISLNDTNALIGNINKFVEEANALGLDVSQKWAKYAEIVAEIRAKAESVGAKAVNIDALPTIELEGIVEEYQEILKTVDDTKAEVLGFTQKFQAISERRKATPTPATATETEVVPTKNVNEGKVVQSESAPNNKKPVALENASSAIATVSEQISPVAKEFLDIPKAEIPTPVSNPSIEFKNSADVRKFAASNLNAKGVKDLARRLGIDTKHANKELLLNEISSSGSSADSRERIAQLIGQLKPDSFLSKSSAKGSATPSTDAPKIIGELKKARKELADALKIAQELDIKDRHIALETIITAATEQEAIAKQLSSEHQLTPAHSKSLGGVRTQLKNISYQSKAALGDVDRVETAPIGEGLGENLVSAIGSGMSNAAIKPIKEIQQVMAGIEGAAKKQAEIRSPSRVFQRIGKFITEGLAVGIKQGTETAEQAIANVMNAVSGVKPELKPETIHEILHGSVRNLSSQVKNFSAKLPIIEDLQADDERRNTPVTNPDKRDNERETIRQRAKLSANLERRHGLEGLAPEILPDRINNLGEVTPAPSTFQGIKDIFKSLDNSVARRVKKRAAQLAIEVDTAIAPGLEGQAIAAGGRGDKVEQRQYQKLARQSRAATSGIAKILETPGDLTEKQVKQLDRLTSQLEKVYDAIGRPLPSQGFLESIGVGAGGAIGLVKSLGGAIKGFLAFSIGMWAQNFFGSVAQEAFKAFVELDRLKTALNFASGGSAGGGQNLAFVRKTVEDLKVPLKASAEGFTQLAAAARNSTLEGKQTRELFLGISQASTVLSLSAEDTQGAILALSQMISKGKVSSEELRQQLGERIPGAMGIAARSMGVTETEFQRLLDTGQLLSQDFLPKFAKQLQSEFGDAAKDASGNAQSAIFGVQNAFLGLQQGIGEGVAPAATAGLNIFAVVLKGIASVAKELGFALLAVSLVLSGKMLAAIGSVLSKMIELNFAGGTLRGGLSSLGQTLNNSASVKWAAGIFAVLEIVNLLNQAINTELVQSFQKAADAAKRAAEETKKAFEKPKPGQESQGVEPVATSGVGRALDKYLVGFLNTDLGPIKGGVFGKKIKTYGQYERDSTTKNIQEQGLSNTESLGEAQYQLAQFKTGTGEAGKLRPIDTQLKIAEEQRAILQAQIKRDFLDKGQTVPSEFKQKLESQNLNITGLNDQRAEAAKPLSLELNRTIQKINSIKTQQEQLNNPDNVAALGGEAAADKQRQDLQRQLEPLKQFRAKLEEALGSLRIDPVRAFTQSLRELNLALTEGQEKNKENLQGRKLANTKTAIAGFSTNKLATKQLAFKNADDEYKAAQVDETNSSKAVNAYNEAANKPDFQATLQRLGLTPDSSVAKIDDILKNTSDEADKGILEKLKAGRESKAKLPEVQAATLEAKTKRSQVVQDNAFFKIDDSAANSRAATTKAENQKTTAVRNAQTARTITEEVASEKISRIGLASTRSQQKNLNQQLAALRIYHDQGAISAEKFAEKERELTTEQTNLEKQEAENRLGVQQAVIARRLKDIEFANKKAESAIALSQVASSAGIKARLLTSGITTSTKDSADLDQNSIDQKAAVDNTALLKTKIAQNQQEYKEGRRNARQFVEEQMALNLELARSHQQLIDLKIAAEEKYRAIVERNISTNKTIASTAIDKRLLAAGLTPQAQDQAAIDKNKVDRKEIVDKINFVKSRVKNESQAKDEIAALDSQLTKLKIESEEKYRESVEHNIQRILQTEETRFKKQTSQIDESKAKLDLYNQSLERTGKLEESRYNLAKALKEAAIAPLESRLNSTNRGLDLVGKLKDTKDPSVKAAIKAQLEQMGIKQYGVTVTPATVTKSSNGNNPDELALQIIEQKAQLEDEIAAKKEEALKLEQEYQRKSLALDLQRQKIAAETAVYDAQSAQLAAAKSKLEAEGALRIAQLKKDPVAIASAKVGLEIADREIKLSDKRLNNALANLSIQDELDASAKTAQSVGQDAAIKSTESANNLSRQGSALELVEAGAKAGNPMSLASAESKTRGQVSPELALPRKIEINQMPKLDLKAGENIFDAYQRQRDAIPPLDKTAQMADATKINPQSSSNQSQFAEALRLANQDVVQRLDKLIDSMATVANTPRSLTVQTPNPVDDAAKLMNDLSRGQVVGAGL